MLGCKVSVILISNHLEAELGNIVGKLFIGGEMISCLRRSFVTTNSSKRKRILFPTKFVVPEGGVANSNSGGVSSFGPPVGVPRRAHCHKPNAISTIVVKYKYFLISYLR